LIGVGTYIRLVDARIEDFWLLSGGNRLRHAYLEIAPEYEPYFVTGHHDDEKAYPRRTAQAPRTGCSA
jgi:hypothetical protein